jgi:hypothetical protein
VETPDLLDFGRVDSENAFIFTCLHAEFRDQTALEAQDSKVTALTDSHRCYRTLVEVRRLDGDFGYGVVSSTPQERPALVSISRLVAGEDILPVVFTELTEIELPDRAMASGDSIVHGLELFLLGEVHAHEFIEQTYVSKVTVLTA